jgi:hypothetical protein
MTRELTPHLNPLPVEERGGRVIIMLQARWVASPQRRGEGEGEELIGI